MTTAAIIRLSRGSDPSEATKPAPSSKSRTLVAPWRGEVDLSDAQAVSGYLLATGASAVINAAAYTAVDKAESAPAAAFHTNAQIPAAISTIRKVVVSASAMRRRRLDRSRRSARCVWAWPWW